LIPLARGIGGTSFQLSAVSFQPAVPGFTSSETHALYDSQKKAES
jgi:hypothetical protein